MQSVEYAKASIDVLMTVLAQKQQELEDWEMDKYKFCLGLKQLDEVSILELSPSL